MQLDSIKKNLLTRFASLAAAALFIGLAGLAAISFTACDDPASSPACTSPVNTGAMITLVSPACGSSFKMGDSLRVKWTVSADADAPDAVDVQLSPDGGATWGFIHKGSIPNTSVLWGNYAWKIDSVNVSGSLVSVVGTQVRIRVMQYSTPDLKKIAVSGDLTITAH